MAVQRNINGLRSESAPGPYGLGPRVLKELQEGLALALTHVFKRSLVECKKYMHMEYVVESGTGFQHG